MDKEKIKREKLIEVNEKTILDFSDFTDSEYEKVVEAIKLVREEKDREIDKLIKGLGTNQLFWFNKGIKETTEKLLSEIEKKIEELEIRGRSSRYADNLPREKAKKYIYENKRKGRISKKSLKKYLEELRRKMQEPK